MPDIYWRKNACALNCMFLLQGLKGRFSCKKFGGTLETDKDGAPTAAPMCPVIKQREANNHQPQYKETNND